MQSNADENNQTDDVIVQEGGEATGRLAVARQPKVIRHESG